MYRVSVRMSIAINKSNYQITRLYGGFFIGETNMNQFVLPKQFVPDENGKPIVGAKAYFYKTGTLQFLTVYQDALFASPHDPENITSDARGVFPPIFIKDETYKCEVRDADDVVISGPHDNLTGQVDLSAIASSKELYNTPVKEIQTDYTATVDDTQKNVLINSKPISDNIKIDLPSAAEVGNGYGVTIRNGHASAYSITINSKDGTDELIDGASSFIITTFNEQLRLTSDGSNWIAARYEIPDNSVDIDQLAPRLRGAFLATGQIVPWVGDPGKAPNGWLIANGQLVNINDYPDLHDKIGVMYGGDGVTTFGLPDLRGYFVRGLDDSAGRDPDVESRALRPDGAGGNSIGTTQPSQFASHTHSHALGDAGSHDHTVVGAFNNVGLSTGGSVYPAGLSSRTTSAVGNHNHSLTIYSAGGNETRPLNFAARWYIVAAPELSAGASGVLTKVHSSIGVPSDTVGINGDLCWDSTNKIMYGPKASGSYTGTGVNLSGTNGLDGASNIFVQDIEPGGNDGDIWVNGTTGSISKKEDGIWGAPLGSFQGPQGVEGPAGPQGAQGLIGPQGLQGIQGDEGPRGVNHLGSWGVSIDYVIADAVERNGSSFICKLDHSSTINDDPGAGSSWETYWNLLAVKGIDGSATINPAPLVGVNITADTTKRFAVRSPETFFDNEGGNHELKVNKNAQADDAGMILQTSLMSHAKVGLVGDDNLHLQVSPDGTAFYEGMVINKDNGILTKPNIPAFSATTNYSSSQDFSTAGVVDFGAIVTNNGSHYTAGRFTAPVAGRYLFNASLFYFLNGNGFFGYFRFTKNGVDAGGSYHSLNSSTANHVNYNTVSGSIIIDMIASDYCEVNTVTGGGATLFGGNYSSFSGYLIG